MLENLSTLHYIYIAIALGITVAIVYTNIQRTALSRFFTSLIENAATSCENAKTMNQLGLSGVYAYIASSSAKRKNGAGKYVKYVGNKSGDKLEAFLDSEQEEKFYLDYADTELITKKYSYKPLSAIKLIGMILALIVTIFVSALLVDLIIDKMMTPDIKIEDSKQEDEEQEENEKDDESKEDDEDLPDDEKDKEGEEAPIPTVPTVPSSPTVPTGPSVPTGPKK